MIFGILRQSSNTHTGLGSQRHLPLKVQHQETLTPDNLQTKTVKAQQL
jgi:hypothetical protein